MFFLIITMTCGCQKVIEPEDLPEQDPKLVLNSVLYTGETPTLNLTSSKSILSGKPFKVITNAECDLYENDSWVERLKHDSAGNYSGKYLPVADRKYTFRINASGFPGIEASTTMPPTVTEVRIERYDTLNASFYNYSGQAGYSTMGGSAKFKIWIKDDPSKKNYYALDAVFFIYDSLGQQVDADLSSSVFDGSNGNYYYGNGEGFETTDETVVNGNEIFLDIVTQCNSSSASAASVREVEVFLKVSNISEEIYRYKQTVFEQASMGPNFFAEPVLVYNNVQNGMGLLGSTNNAGLIRLVKQKLVR